jgi:uncharacterized protein Yka (UPF0111/DUF47 family)
MVSSFKQLLRKLLPPNEVIFFSYFEESAKICHKCVDILCEVLQQGEVMQQKATDECSVAARELKHASNDLTKKTFARLNTAFITPIDREDIYYLNKQLNKLARKIVKIIFLFNNYQLSKYTNYLIEQSKTLLQAADELNFIVSKFKNFKKFDKIAKSNERMDEIETHGDEILQKALMDLFSGKHDNLTVIKLKDIYNSIEDALDLYFTISDSIVNIALKHI